MSSCLLPDRKFLGAAVATGCMLLASCTVDPKYQRPVTPAPPQYKEGTAPATGVANPIAYSNWWLIFHDDQLNRLEQQVDASDQDIQAAMARVEQAQAYARAARSYLFPSISAGDRPVAAAKPKTGRTMEIQGEQRLLTMYPSDDPRLGPSRGPAGGGECCNRG